jgi:hypothetical protein
VHAIPAGHPPQGRRGLCRQPDSGLKVFSQIASTIVFAKIAMSINPIPYRYAPRTIFEADPRDLKEAVELAVRSELDLEGADLRGAELRGADLRGARLYHVDLRGAYLFEAKLCRANLSRAELGGAEMAFCDLTDADLTDAHFYGTRISLTEFAGATLAWQSHELLGELLRCEAGEDLERLKIAGLVLLQHPLCWRGFFRVEKPLRDWGLNALAKSVRPGDGAPESLRRIAATPAEAEPADSRDYWTSRGIALIG